MGREIKLNLYRSGVALGEVTIVEVEDGEFEYDSEAFLTNRAINALESFTECMDSPDIRKEKDGSFILQFSHDDDYWRFVVKSDKFADGKTPQLVQETLVSISKGSDFAGYYSLSQYNDDSYEVTYPGSDLVPGKDVVGVMRAIATSLPYAKPFGKVYYEGRSWSYSVISTTQYFDESCEASDGEIFEANEILDEDEYFESDSSQVDLGWNLEGPVKVQFVTDFAAVLDDFLKGQDSGKVSREAVFDAAFEELYPEESAKIKEAKAYANDDSSLFTLAQGRSLKAFWFATAGLPENQKALGAAYKALAEGLLSVLPVDCELTERALADLKVSRDWALKAKE